MPVPPGTPGQSLLPSRKPVNLRQVPHLMARAAWVPVTMLLAGTLTWAATTLLPGDAASRILGAHATPERLAHLRTQLGLDRPVIVQFGDWLGGLLRGDLGVSAVSGRPITDLVLTRLGNSLVLAGVAAALALLCGLTVGVLIGRMRRPRMANGLVIAATAVPDFVLGAILVGTLAVSWRWLPALSILPPGESVLTRPQMLVIPALAMAVPAAAWTARYTTAATARHTQAEHVRAARLAGLSERRVLLWHLLPGALAPLVQLFGWISALLVGSAVVVEQLVEYPGIGTLLVEAVGNRDLTLTTAVVVTLSGVVATTLFLSDLLAEGIDPRLRGR